MSALLALGCGEDTAPDADVGTDSGAMSCEIEPFEVGSDGATDPLTFPDGEARAGRIHADALPDFESRLQVWEDDDFVLANQHLAMVIEDAGASDLYDPWGGRPVGIAQVGDGTLVSPADFGEILILVGRFTVLTQRVSVIADGTDGGPAIVRAEGVLRPLPFFEEVVGPLLSDDYSALHAAIDYVLEPDARYVDVMVRLRPGDNRTRGSITLHAFMHTPRMPPFAPGVGFEVADQTVPYVGFSDEDATSYAYVAPDRNLGSGFEVSGFVSFLTAATPIPPCMETTRHHARIIVGAPGSAGVVRAALETEGVDVAEVSGVVRDASGNAMAGVWVLAQDADGGFVSRTVSDGDGAYRIAYAADQQVSLVAFQRGDRPTAPAAVSGDTLDLTLGEAGYVHVVVTEGGEPVPARVQLMPVDPDPAPGVDERFGIPAIPSGRIAVEFPTDGETTMRAPAGAVRVVVSRGYEYELIDTEVDVSEGNTVELPVSLERVVDTTGVVCGDFHIHTHRSNDSGDDARLKVRSAVADGVELPVRSEHEYVATFQPIIEELGLEAFAAGIGSIEMTSFEAWGHMGVVPLEPDPTAINAGAPLWQRYPTVEEPDRALETLGPVTVFDAVRARPERPLVIINHPRGDPNYFDYVGYDNTTGMVTRASDWDETFRLVEVFNDSSWTQRRNGLVQDWLSLLAQGRRVFAVGSSDSHGISSSPVGYPRTCLRLGTDDPSLVTAAMVRDALAAGHFTVSGGIYVDTDIDGIGPGGEVTAGATVTVNVRVQAANWVDLDRVEVVVDGVGQVIDVMPGDGDPLDSETRFVRAIEVPVATSGSYVIVAAYGDAALDPVHPRRLPFGVSNPIFIGR